MDIETDLLKRLESGYSLPVLSLVAIRLVELASDEECSVNDLVSLIEKDPSLAIRLLKSIQQCFLQDCRAGNYIKTGGYQDRFPATAHHGPLFVPQGYIPHGHNWRLRL